MMLMPDGNQGNQKENTTTDISHIEIQLSAKDLTFLFSGFATLLAFVGAGFMVFNNEVCKPVIALNIEEIREIKQKMVELQIKLDELKKNKH